MIRLPGEESCAFVRGLFTFVLHLCDAGAKLHGSLGQDGWLAEAQLLRRQSQEEFLPNSSRKRQICLLPHGQRIQEAHHILVQVRKSAVARELNQFIRYSNLNNGLSSAQLTALRCFDLKISLSINNVNIPQKTLSTNRPEKRSEKIRHNEWRCRCGGQLKDVIIVIYSLCISASDEKSWIQKLSLLSLFVFEEGKSTQHIR